METPFSKFIKDNLKEDLIGIEIGTQAGVNARYLLEDLPIKELYLVDNYKTYHSGSVIFSSEEQEGAYALALELAREYFGKAMVIKQDSVWVKDVFPDEYFDFIYIDAGHTYNNVMDDLNYWWDKCKFGGVFGGHDYGYPTTPGVKRAVDDFLKIKLGLKSVTAEKNYNPEIGLRVGESMEWAIIKPYPEKINIHILV